MVGSPSAKYRRPTVTAPTDCYACLHADAPELRERLLVRGGWRVAHDFNSSLAGWLIVAPLRHLESLDLLTDEEAAALGPLLRGASVAIKAVTGCDKTYVMLFAEAAGFSHLHIHVVPRMDDLPEERRGPGVFAYLKETPIGVDAREAIAERLVRAWPD